MRQRRRPSTITAPRVRRIPAEVPEAAPRAVVLPQAEPVAEATRVNPSDTALSDDAIRKMLEAAYT